MQVETTATNWVRVANADDKMIVTNTGLVETFLLKPLFHSFQHEVSERIKGKISSTPKSYEDAKTLLENGRGFRFRIADYRTSHDGYLNYMDAEFINTDTATQISIRGKLFFHKIVEMVSVLSGTARWEAGSTVNWKAAVTIAQPIAGSKNGELQLTHSTPTHQTEGFSDKNRFTKFIDNNLDIEARTFLLPTWWMTNFSMTCL